MKLYYSPGACSLSARIALNEMNVTCDYVRVDLATKKTAHGVDFLTINPQGAVPTLELDNGDILTENVAILIYLADKYHDLNLLPPPSDFKRYRVLQWLSFITSDVHKSFAPFFNSSIPHSIASDYFKPVLKKKLDIMNERLMQHDFLACSHFTLADAYAFVTLTWLPATNLTLNEFKALSSYVERLKSRPQLAAALKDDKS